MNPVISVSDIRFRRRPRYIGSSKNFLVFTPTSRQMGMVEDGRMLSVIPEVRQKVNISNVYRNGSPGSSNVKRQFPSRDGCSVNTKIAETKYTRTYSSLVCLVMVADEWRSKTLLTIGNNSYASFISTRPRAKDSSNFAFVFVRDELDEGSSRLTRGPFNRIESEM
jgi:hypothetical protein